MIHVFVILSCILIFNGIKGKNNGCILNLIKGSAAAVIIIYLVGLLILILTMLIMFLVSFLDLITH